jgi:hypothetical protein
MADKLHFHESARIGDVAIELLNSPDDGHGWELFFDTSPGDDHGSVFTMTGDQLADILDRWNVSVDIGRIKSARANAG